MKYLFNIIAIVTIGSAVSFINNEPDKTLINLKEAYELEANEAYKYDQYAKVAEKEGYIEVANLLWAISQSKVVHMNNHRNAMEQLGCKPGEIEYQIIEVGSTVQNLKEPIESKEIQPEELYQEFIRIARSEDAEAAERSFRYAMSADKRNDRLLQKALNNLGDLDENEPSDFYVSNITGEIVEVSAEASAPESERDGEEYVKVN